ncbi:FG-GAP repeat domain-containing protein [Engelhardtia mirabilis]|uniref:FG-GAP repeat protein n=1 Tax=Engelhardtia mirabilis TaxID=2528011 RepID=A0A518BJV3_9BACT|nr:FG-GAP repeat protein [Planctomycetes bacterium Pla133]QDV01583.1 FG-GAP repeat protein [Planctomycetes bacterium Pla86]
MKVHATAVLAFLTLFGCSKQAAQPPHPDPGADVAAQATSAPATGWFEEISDRCGVDFVHDAGFSDERHLPETMGGGAALIDADEDGDLDLYLVQGGPMPVGAAVVRDDSMPPNRLFLGDGRGSFVDGTDASGDAANREYGQGVAAGDVDGDGRTDLYVTNFGPDALLLGSSGHGFVDGTAAAGLADGRWTAGASLFDADRDGDLDLYVTGYVAIDVDEPEWCGRTEPGWRSYCHPDRYEGLEDRFWRNEGDGRFVDGALDAGLVGTGGKGLGVIPADFDLDGDLDLYVANDSVENRFWRNSGEGHFDDETALSGAGVNGDGMTEAGMGLAVADVDGDLDLDLYVTNFDNESNTLYRNDGEWFEDGTVVAGLEGPSRLPVGFGTVICDFDADGNPDICVANGHIIHNIDLYHDGKTWRQPAQLYVGRGRGRFRLASEELGDLAQGPFVGRGLLQGDLDGDGDPDLVLVECGGPTHVYANRAADSARGLLVRGMPPHAVLRATLDDGSQRLAVAGPQPSYYCATAPEAFIGLGSEGQITKLELVSPRVEVLRLDAAREVAPGHRVLGR